MTISGDQILALYKERQKRYSRIHEAGLLLRRVYDGEHLVVLPEIERAERSAMANLIKEGVDQHGMRIASQTPTINFPPTRASRSARNRADTRRQTIQAWWHENRVPAKLRWRARHLVGLGTSPVYIRPGTDGIPCWEVRDPLSTYPSPMEPDELVPHDVIFGFRRSIGWLREHYEIAAAAFPLSRDTRLDTMVDVLQYCDAEEFVLLAVGKPDPDTYTREAQRVPAVVLQRVPNIAERPCVIIPGRISMSRLQGQFDQLVGMYESQSKLWALHVHALQRAIFSEVWLESRAQETPQILAEADPYQGEVGVVQGGILREFRADPSVQTLQSIDRLERGQRIEGPIPAEFGGESPTNVRTDRRGQSVLSGSIDFYIQEHQEILARSMEEEDKVAIAIAKAYWPNTTRTFPIAGGRGSVTYTPSTTFDTDNHTVAYGYSGTDMNGLIIGAGQRLGMGTLSKETWMEHDPMVQDPDFEHDRIVAESIEAAFLSSLQQQAANPQGIWTPADYAAFARLVKDEDVDLYEATERINTLIQERQAAAAQGQLSPVEMQPGLAPPGAPGTATAGQPIGPPQPSMENLTSILGNLRLQQRRAPAEVG